MGFLRSLQEGDEHAFEHLVRTQRARLLAAARRILANEEDAQDAVQETFIAAVNGVNRFAGRSHLSTWLHRILINACFMTLRRRRSRPERLFAELPEPRAHAPAVGSDAEREEIVQAVRAGIDRLPDSYRDVLLLREIHGVETKVAARTLRVSPNAVKTRLYRAKRALRSELKPLFRLAIAG